MLDFSGKANTSIHCLGEDDTTSNVTDDMSESVDLSGRRTQQCWTGPLYLPHHRPSFHVSLMQQLFNSRVAGQCIV